MGPDLIALWECTHARSRHDVARALLLRARADLGPDQIAALPLGHRDRLLLDLRAGLFGPAVTFRAVCPCCGEALEAEIPDLRRGAPPTPGPHTIDLDGHALRFRLPTGDDIAAAAVAPDPAAELVRRCLLEFAGPAHPDLAGALLTASAELDPDADLRLELACAACSHVWSAAFDVVAFLSAELASRAPRLAREVALLARAFGWREADILALSPARRQLYLDLALSLSS